MVSFVVIRCACIQLQRAYLALFSPTPCFYHYSSYFISFSSKDILFQCKDFRLTDEKYYRISSKKDMNEFLFTTIY